MVTSPGGARDAILDAAYDAAVAGDWDRTRMADVAAQAGFSRQTLYNEFTNKDGLAIALALRELDRFLDGTDEACADAGDVVEALESAMAVSLRMAADNPLLKAILTTKGDAGLLPFLTTRSDAIIDVATTRLVANVLQLWPDLDPTRLGVVAETVVRLTVSHMMQPSASAEETARTVTGLVTPFLLSSLLP